MRKLKQIPVARRFSVHGFYTALDFNWNDRFLYDGETHDFWEIVYVVSGAAEATENDRVYLLTEGNMLIHAPMEFHNIRSAGGTSPHVLVLTFAAEGTLPENLTDGAFLLPEPLRRNYEMLFAQAKTFVDQSTAHPDGGQECADRLAVFLLNLSRSHSAEKPQPPSRGAAEYQRLVRSMTDRVCDNCTLEELARQNAISLSYMKVLFRRYAGISPKVYYDRLRCSEAIRLLQSGMTSAQTADHMNFSSPNYFSAFFRKMTGFSPLRYLRR